MQDTAAQRQTMVETQLRTNDVRDARVRDAMLGIPRERFVPPAQAAIAYMDGCIEVTPGRALLDPRCFAKLIQLAAIEPNDSVLDVGCCTGYSTAVLARLARQVVGLEEDGDLARIAVERLRFLGVEHTRIVQGPLADGWSKEAPYDVIFLGGAVEGLPRALLAQLKDDGRLVCVEREGPAGHAHLYVRHDGVMGDYVAFDAQVPVLPGFRKKSAFVF